jgi:predicted transcriptional regulator YdeE
LPINSHKIQLTPRFEDHKSLNLIGLFQNHSLTDLSGIAKQWKEFREIIGTEFIDENTQFFGVCSYDINLNTLNYAVATHKHVLTSPHQSLKNFEVSQGRWAIFSQTGHISLIGDFWHAIFNQWDSSWGKISTTTPQLEVYDKRYDRKSASGTIEIWVALEN